MIQCNNRGSSLFLKHSVIQERQQFGPGWTEPNQGLDMPALDCCLLNFWRWKCRMHALTDDTSSNINYFPFCGWCEVWFIWNKQKQKSKCYTWTKSGTKNVLQPNWSNVGPKRSRTRTWTYTNTNHNYDHSHSPQ